MVVMQGWCAQAALRPWHKAYMVAVNTLQLCMQLPGGPVQRKLKAEAAADS